MGPLERGKTILTAQAIGIKSSVEVRSDLLAKREIALLDVREEALHAEGHPLFAANLPLSRLELEAYTRLPRRSVPIVALDDGDGSAKLAAERLLALGYSDVKLLDGGLAGWRESGGEPDIGLCESRGVIDAITCHRHNAPFGAKPLHDFTLVAGQHVSFDMVDAEFSCDRLGRLAVVAGEPPRLRRHSRHRHTSGPYVMARRAREPFERRAGLAERTRGRRLASGTYHRSIVPCGLATLAHP